MFNLYSIFPKLKDAPQRAVIQQLIDTK